MSAVALTVIGSVNLDLVAHAARLPAPGETVGGARLGRYPGGKGANQALAARRLGADVRLIARVGADAMAAEALALLRADGVDLSGVQADGDAPTGVALIAVAADGENQIVVAPGANARLHAADVPPSTGALLCQLEVPVETVLAGALAHRGFVALNLAPALPVPDALLVRADLLIVNEGEAQHFGAALHRSAAWVAVTHGADGAVLLQHGREIARCPGLVVTAVDTTGAGDAFSAALTVALVEGQAPASALRFACAAGAAAATCAGAQPSLPRRAAVEALLKEQGA